MELLGQHGFDADSYRKGTLWRRIEQRMALLSCSGWRTYVEHVEADPAELTALHAYLLVGVTQFFRNPEQWEYLEQEIAPHLIRTHADERKPIRIWSAGCSTGEEAYGLAMVFLEQIERMGSPLDVQVFATDPSHEAVALARKGAYPKSIARDVPDRRLARFFDARGDAYQIGRRIRDKVIVSRHDLSCDPPFSWIDLVCCRNVLIYFEPHAQRECLRRFHFSLLPHGVLWLGTAEAAGRHDPFRAILPEYSMYQRIEGHQRGKLPWSLSPRAGDVLAPPLPDPVLAKPSSSELTHTIERFVLARQTAACVVVDRVGDILHLFGPTAGYLMHPTGEVRHSLIARVQPGLQAKLLPALQRALDRSEPVVVEGAHVRRGDHTVEVTCTIERIPSTPQGLLLVTFRDEAQSRARIERASRIVAAEESEDPSVQRLAQELDDTREALNRALYDIASMHEEHRAGYEVLSALNEELRASNLELESSKADAQSLTEELMAVNLELEERSSHLHAVNAELEKRLAESDEQGTTRGSGDRE